MSGELIFADRKYRKMAGTWMVQPATLRGFIAVTEESTIAMLDEMERLRAMTAEQALVHDAWLAERDLADQLAEALGNSHDDPDGRFNRQAVNALAAWEEARHD